MTVQGPSTIFTASTDARGPSSWLDTVCDVTDAGDTPDHVHGPFQLGPERQTVRPVDARQILPADKPAENGTVAALFGRTG
jgi:hypothetical protein